MTAAIILSGSPSFGFLTRSGLKDCRGATVEQVLGYSSTQARGGTPRSLAVCRGKNGLLYHTLDWPCDDGDAEIEELGFVH